MSNNKIILEKEIRFSQSMMWGDQKRYYDEKGIDAWEDDVPFYITSNPFIGHGYAKMAIEFIQDWIHQHPESKNEPFTFLELGAGTGQFSFYFLKSFVQIQKMLKLDHIKIRYIMSDLTDKSFSFWGSHHALKPFVDSGVLEFLAFDLYHPKKDDIKTENPLIIVANYLFDSVGTDVFSVKEGQLYESVVTLTTDESNLINNKPRDWEKVTIEYTDKPIYEKYYDNEFDDVLFSYQKKLSNTSFQFPIASLQAIHNLQTFCKDRFLLLTSDKGYTNLEELDECDYPELDFHGSFSVMVNYHAIGEYLKRKQGDYIIQSFRDNIVTGAFTSGFALNQLPHFSLAAKEVIAGFSPTDYFLIYEYFVEHYKTCSIEVMSAYLNLSGWDPYVFDHVSDYFCELAEKADPEIVSYLSEHMHLIADNFYYMPSCNDILFDIGLFFQNVDRFERAIHYYQLSLSHFGESDVTLFNMGMCYYSLDKNKEAVHYLKRAQNLNQDAKDVEEWIETINKEK